LKHEAHVHPLHMASCSCILDTLTTHVQQGTCVIAVSFNAIFTDD
jgi:hypothetical protein